MTDACRHKRVYLLRAFWRDNECDHAVTTPQRWRIVKTSVRPFIFPVLTGMNANDRITDCITKTPANSNDGSECRHYLGLWHLNISDCSDLLGCAWRERGQWHMRIRLRHGLDYPLCYEARYEQCLGVRSEEDARSFVSRACCAANVLDRPITYAPVEGLAGKAIQVVFGRPELLAWAMDEQTLPVVPKAAAERLNLIFLRGYQSGFQGDWELRGRQEFEQLLATAAEFPAWQPNQFGFWVLDLTAAGPAGTQGDTNVQAKVQAQRTRWLAWARSHRLQRM